MAEVIGVRFKNTGKVYYFDPQARAACEKGDHGHCGDRPRAGVRGGGLLDNTEVE